MKRRILFKCDRLTPWIPYAFVYGITWLLIVLSLPELHFTKEDFLKCSLLSFVCNVAPIQSIFTCESNRSAHNVNQAFRKHSVNDGKMQRWFQKFRSGDLPCKTYREEDPKLLWNLILGKHLWKQIQRLWTKRAK